MATIKWRSMLSDDGRDGWYAPRQRMGYLGDPEGHDNHEDPWESRRGARNEYQPHPAYGYYPPDPQRMMMRMHELEKEKKNLEQAMQRMPMVHELHPELIEKLEKLFNEAVEVASNPPETWDEYLQKKDFASIVSMESKELLDELKQKKLPKEIKKELTHTIAALLRAGVR